MSLSKEIVKSGSWMLMGVFVLATIEAIIFPEQENHFLTIAAIGLMAGAIGLQASTLLK